MKVDSPKAYTISDVDSMPAEMTTPLQLSPLRLVPVGTKAVDLDFDGGRLASDAGLVLLRDPDAPPPPWVDALSPTPFSVMTPSCVP